MKGGFACPQCGSQLGNKLSGTGCPNCHRQFDGSEQWSSFVTSPGGVNNNPVMNIMQMQRAARSENPEPSDIFKDPVMPTNIHVRQQTVPDSFNRRRKKLDLSTISDENAENIDEEHIANCCESADDLAIDE